MRVQCCVRHVIPFYTLCNVHIYQTLCKNSLLYIQKDDIVICCDNGDIVDASSKVEEWGSRYIIVQVA